MYAVHLPFPSRAPPSPSFGVHNDDIQRLRALLDAERSRRVAAENAISNGGGGGGPSSRRGGGAGGAGSGACTPTSAATGGTATPRSRSYSGLHKSAMLRAVEAQAAGPGTPKSHRDRSGSGGEGLGDGGSGGGGGAELGAPSRSFGNLANMVATPRRTRLSYSALHKFPSPRAVEAHALEAAENGAKWVQSVVARLSGRGGVGGGGGGGVEEQRRQSVSAVRVWGEQERIVCGKLVVYVYQPQKAFECDCACVCVCV